MAASDDNDFSALGAEADEFLLWTLEPNSRKSLSRTPFKLSYQFQLVSIHIHQLLPPPTLTLSHLISHILPVIREGDLGSVLGKFPERAHLQNPQIILKLPSNHPQIALNLPSIYFAVSFLSITMAAERDQNA